MSAYESIMQGLTEALDPAQGKPVGARVRQVSVPAVDVAAIRASTGLSQGAFARSIGVAKGPCSTGNTAAAARPVPPRCCWPCSQSNPPW